MPVPKSLERAHGRVKLLRLLKDGPMDTGQLSRETSNVQTSTAELLRMLPRDGFVLRHASQNSKKPDTWEITDAGMAAVT